MILYLHGFLSTGKSLKAQWYQQAFKEQGIELLAPTYPLASPLASIDYLHSYIQDHILSVTSDVSPPAWQIFGSSMGGFYGEYLARLYQVPLVMINPALNPIPLFNENIGEHIHPKTEEKIVINEQFIRELGSLISAVAVVPSLLLQDKDDEVIPYEFAYQKYATNGKVLAFEGGYHAFQHLDDSWGDVLDFIQTVNANL